MEKLFSVNVVVVPSGKYFVPAYDHFARDESFFSKQEGAVVRLLEIAEEYYGVTTGTFLDLGANLGTTTMVALRHPQVKHVLAVEPTSPCYACLKGTLALSNKEDHVTVVRAALNEEPGELEIIVNQKNTGDSYVSGTPKRVVIEDNHAAARAKVVAAWPREIVRAATVDELLAEHNIDDAGFMWIDTQGWEFHVLAGAEKLLSRGIATIIELWPHRLDEPEQLFSLLCRHFTHFIDLRGKEERPISEVRDVFEQTLQRARTNNQVGNHTDLFLIQS